MSQIARFELPDGRIARFEVPDGTSPEQAQSMIEAEVSGSAQKAPPAQPRPADMPSQIPGVQPLPRRPLVNDNPNFIDRMILDKFGPQLAKAPDIQGSIPGRVIQGMADLPVGAMQLGLNMAGQGDLVNPEIAAINRRTEQLRGPNAGFDFARLAGNIVSPLPFAAARALPQTATTMGRIGQGAILGMAGGATAPVFEEGDYAGDKAQQIVTGGVLGALLPAGVEATKAGGRLVRNVIDPMLPGGATRAAGRLANEVAGTRAPQVAAALQAARPGQTAGQAAVPAGSAEFSALQRIAAENDPSLYAGIDRAQAAARQGVLQNIAGGADDTALNAAIAARRAATGPLYRAAEQSAAPVDVTAMVTKLDDLIARKPGNTELVTELNRIKSGLTGSARNIGFGPSTGQASAEGVVSTIDGIKAAIAKKDNAFIQSNLIDLRDSLKSVVPGYSQADDVFRQMSAPVNQMQVGRVLEKSLQNPSNAETAGTYLRALDDAAKTLKKATGFARYSDISDVLTPQQAAQARSVAAELENNLAMKDLANRGAIKARQLTGQFADSIPQTNFLERTMMIVNAITRRLEGKASKATMEELSKKMADPQQMAKIMLEAKPIERKLIIDNLMKYQALVGGTATAQQQPQTGQ